MLEKHRLLVEESGLSPLVARLQRALLAFTVVYPLLFGLVNLGLVLGWSGSERMVRLERHLYLHGDYPSLLIAFSLSLFMIYLSYQLWLRKRAALWVLAIFLLCNAGIDILRREDLFLAIAVLIVILALFAIRDGFPAKPDPYYARRCILLLPLFTSLYFFYGMGVLYLLRDRLGLVPGPFSLAQEVALITLGESNIVFNGWTVVFRNSMILMALSGFVYLTILIFKPHRPFLEQDPEDRKKALELIRRYGSDSLSYFNIREDKNLFLQPGGIFLAYRCVRGVAVISGDPVGPQELIPEMMGKFRKWCLERGWRVASIGSKKEFTPFYEAAGFRCFCIGEETVIHLDEFSLEGRKMRKLRHAVTKFQKMGATMEFMFNVSVPPHLRHELAQIAAEWRGGLPETGFSMGLGRLLHSEDENCLLAVAYDADSRPMGFLYLVPMYPRLGYSLDTARTRKGITNGLNEFMISSTALFLKERGYRYLSLHFCFFSHHYREDREEPGSALARALARLLSYRLPVISLYHFDKKFQPHWNKRYVVYESPVDLPRIALASLDAESAFKLRRPKVTGRFIKDIWR